MASVGQDVGPTNGRNHHQVVQPSSAPTGHMSNSRTSPPNRLGQTVSVPPGTNFTNIWWAVFCAKVFLCSFYMLTVWLWDFWQKEIGSKMFVKITIGVNFTNILLAPFCKKEYLEAFLYYQFGFVIYLGKEIGAKDAHKMFLKLTKGVRLIGPPPTTSTRCIRGSSSSSSPPSTSSCGHQVCDVILTRESVRGRLQMTSSIFLDIFLKFILIICFIIVTKSLTHSTLGGIKSYDM